MPTFRTLLDDTLFFMTKPTDSQLLVTPRVKVELPKESISDAHASFQNIWSFEHDAATPAKIKNLTALARGMGNVRVQVCDRIEFEGVSVKTDTGQTISLPLSDSFVVFKTFCSAHSLAAGSAMLLPFQSEIDTGMLVAFVYDFVKGVNAAPQKPSDDKLNREEFMPEPGGRTQAGRSVSGGQTLTATVEPLRIVVFLSFVCCKERRDFEPGGVLGAGRVFPHLMIMANRPLLEARTLLHIDRPSKLSILEGTALPHIKHHMNETIDNALFADNNLAVPTNLLIAKVPPSPLWNNLFATYLTGRVSGSFSVVRPDAAARTINGVMENLQSDAFDISAAPRKYLPMPVPREARQGALDNIHVAPTMRNATLSSPADTAKFHLDKIFMAPFCEHDCFHTHWRWGAKLSNPEQFGWSPGAGTASRFPGKPFAVAGQPMIPHNQRLTLTLRTSSGFTYDVAAIGRSPKEPASPIPAGTYSLFNQHGSAYALDVDPEFFRAVGGSIDALVAAEDEPMIGTAVLADRSDTSLLYWHLRFGGNNNLDLSKTIVQERLRVTDEARLLAE